MTRYPLPVNTIWIGKSLGLIERACLRSFLRAGHSVRLFLYEKPDGVPEGVETHDAREILPQTAIFRHHSGSPALFSDYFRYKLQALELGYWVDTDVYCVRPFKFSEPLVVGWEDQQFCNGAVLLLPAKSELLNALLSIFEESRLPAWLPWRERLGFVIDRRQSIRFPLRSRLTAAATKNFLRRDLTKALHWGAAGPWALTHYVNAFGIAGRVQAREVFYPAHHSDAAWIFDPARSLDSIITAKTRAVHLWNFALGETKDRPAPTGSFLERLRREGD